MLTDTCAAAPRPPQMSGTFKLDSKGNVELLEQDGIDFAPVTVKVSLAGWEDVAEPGWGRHCMPGSNDACTARALLAACTPGIAPAGFDSLEC